MAINIILKYVYSYSILKRLTPISIAFKRIDFVIFLSSKFISSVFITVHQPWFNVLEL